MNHTSKRSSTAFLPPAKSVTYRRSEASLNLNSVNNNTPEDMLFDTLMRDPTKRALILQMLTDERENIARYKSKKRKKELERKRLKKAQCESPIQMFRRRALQKLNASAQISINNLFSQPKVTSTAAVPFANLLEGVIAYVEIKGDGEDRSAGAKALMQAMGATIRDCFSSDVTHVIFKDGSFTTYQRAVLLKVHLVSVLWLEAVRKNNYRICEKKFPAVGTAAFDINISQICKDYENILNEEMRLSRAMNLSKTLTKNHRHSELVLPCSLSPSCSVLPVESTQQRNFSPWFSNEFDSTPDVISDSDSDCATVDGHSFKRNSILPELDLQSIEKNLLSEEDDQGNNSNNSLDLLDSIKNMKQKKQESSTLNSEGGKLNDTSNNKSKKSTDSDKTPSLRFSANSKDATEKSKRKNSSLEVPLTALNLNNGSCDVINASDSVPSLRLSSQSDKENQQRVPTVENEIDAEKESSKNGKGDKEVFPIDSGKTNNVLLKNKRKSSVLINSSARKSSDRRGNTDIVNEVNDLCRSHLNDFISVRKKTKRVPISANTIGDINQKTKKSVTALTNDDKANADATNDILDHGVDVRIQKETDKSQNFECCETPNAKKLIKKGKSKTENRSIRTRKLKRLYNLNCSYDAAAFENFIWSEEQQKEQPVKKAAISTRKKNKVNVLLAPISITPNAKKFLESQKNKRAEKETTAKKDKIESAEKNKHDKKTNKSQKKKTAPKQIRNVCFNSSDDEQKELAKECASKPLTSRQTRRSQRLTQCKEKLHTDSASSDTYNKNPIEPNLNRRSTLEFVEQKESRKKVPKKKKTSIVCTRMHRPEVQEFEEVVKTLKGFFTENEVTANTSHLVVGEPKRTVNLLRALARGCWIVQREWICESLKAGKWLPEEDFELTSFSSAVQKSRKEKQAFGSLYSMDIFEKCGTIFVSRKSSPPQAEMQELVKLCNGCITKNISTAEIVVGEKVLLKGLTCVNELWVLDSITWGKCKTFKNYSIC